MRGAPITHQRIHHLVARYRGTVWTQGEPIIACTTAFSKFLRVPDFVPPQMWLLSERRTVNGWGGLMMVAMAGVQAAIAMSMALSEVAVAGGSQY